jgi:hypothetical protein
MTATPRMNFARLSDVDRYNLDVAYLIRRKKNEQMFFIPFVFFHLKIIAFHFFFLKI